MVQFFYKPEVCRDAFRMLMESATGQSPLQWELLELPMTSQIFQSTEELEAAFISQSSITNHHKLGGLKHRDLFSHRSESWKYRIKASAEPSSPEGSTGESLLASSGFWGLLTLLGITLVSAYIFTWFSPVILGF